MLLMPASLLGAMVASATYNRVELANTSGTLWKGQATPVILQRDGGLIVLDSFAWELDLPALLKATLRIQLKWDSVRQEAPMEINITPRQLEVKQLYLPLSASLIGETSEFIKPAGLRGRIIVRGDTLLISQQGVLGKASAEWLEASSLLSSVSPLGNYRLDFDTDYTRLAIQLSSISGALRLSGQGTMLPNKGLSFSGKASAASGQEDALKELLNHLGPELSPGVRTFTIVPTAGQQ
jgi:general secretion pathway protein N